jgi:hypothetical protein
MHTSKLNELFKKYYSTIVKHFETHYHYKFSFQYNVRINLIVIILTKKENCQ